MKKSLLETNPYLKDPAKRKKLLRRSLVSSFAIEEIYLKEETADSVKASRLRSTVPLDPGSDWSSIRLEVS